MKYIFEVEIARFVYFYYLSMLHENFDYYFKYASKHHGYKTKSITAGNFYMERAKTRNGQRSCSCIAVKIWNKLIRYCENMEQNITNFQTITKLFVLQKNKLVYAKYSQS